MCSQPQSDGDPTWRHYRLSTRRHERRQTQPGSAYRSTSTVDDNRVTEQPSGSLGFGPSGLDTLWLSTPSRAFPLHRSGHALMDRDEPLQRNSCSQCHERSVTDAPKPRDTRMLTVSPFACTGKFVARALFHVGPSAESHRWFSLIASPSRYELRRPRPSFGLQLARRQSGVRCLVDRRPQHRAYIRPSMAEPTTRTSRMFARRCLTSRRAWIFVRLCLPVRLGSS